MSLSNTTDSNLCYLVDQIKGKFCFMVFLFITLWGLVVTNSSLAKLLLNLNQIVTSNFT